MQISTRQQRIGAIYGALGVGLGLAITWWVTPEQIGDTSRLRRAMWLFLSAHMITVGPVKAGAAVENFQRLALVARGARPEIWYLVPAASAFFGSVGANIALGGSKNRNTIIENSLMAAIGYFGAVLVVMVYSNATPTIGVGILILGVGLLALTIGSTVVGQAGRRGGGTPMLGITSLGPLILVGLVVLMIGFVVVRVSLPIAVFAGGGAGAAAALVYGARNYNI